MPLNFLRISCPKMDDIVCRTVVVAGTCDGVTSVSVTFAGESKLAEIDTARGLWKATFLDVTPGTYTVTALGMPNSLSASESNITVVSPCRLVVLAPQPWQGSTGSFQLVGQYDPSTVGFVVYEVKEVNSTVSIPQPFPILSPTERLYYRDISNIPTGEYEVVVSCYNDTFMSTLLGRVTVGPILVA